MYTKNVLHVGEGTLKKAEPFEISKTTAGKGKGPPKKKKGETMRGGFGNYKKTKPSKQK